MHGEISCLFTRQGNKEQNELDVRGNEGLESELTNHTHTSGQTRQEDAKLNGKLPT
jgi:hypothetical protein